MGRCWGFSCNPRETKTSWRRKRKSLKLSREQIKGMLKQQAAAVPVGVDSDTGSASHQRNESFSLIHSRVFFHLCVVVFFAFAGTFVKKPCERDQQQGICEPCEHGQTHTEHSNGMGRCLPCNHCRQGNRPPCLHRDRLDGRSCETLIASLTGSSSSVAIYVKVANESTSLFWKSPGLPAVFWHFHSF